MLIEREPLRLSMIERLLREKTHDDAAERPNVAREAECVVVRAKPFGGGVQRPLLAELVAAHTLPLLAKAKSEHLRRAAVVGKLGRHALIEKHIARPKC